MILKNNEIFLEDNFIGVAKNESKGLVCYINRLFQDDVSFTEVYSNGVSFVSFCKGLENINSHYSDNNCIDAWRKGSKDVDIFNMRAVCIKKSLYYMIPVFGNSDVFENVFDLSLSSYIRDFDTGFAGFALLERTAISAQTAYYLFNDFVSALNNYIANKILYIQTFTEKDQNYPIDSIKIIEPENLTDYLQDLYGVETIFLNKQQALKNCTAEI